MTAREDVPVYNSTGKCSICLDHISQMAEITKCRHQFCYPCLLQWTVTQRNDGADCPNCRTRYNEEDIRTGHDVFRQNAGSEPIDEHTKPFHNEARSNPRGLQGHERDAQAEPRHERVLSAQPFGLRRRTGFRCQD